MLTIEISYTLTNCCAQVLDGMGLRAVERGQGWFDTGATEQNIVARQGSRFAIFLSVGCPRSVGTHVCDAPSIAVLILASPGAMNQYTTQRRYEATPTVRHMLPGGMGVTKYLDKTPVETDAFGTLS